MGKPAKIQFSLRTLLVLVSIFAIWLGWTLWQVRERADMARRIEDDGGSVLFATAQIEARGQLPYSLRLFGVSPAAFIMVKEGYSREEWDRIEDVFPEAVVAPIIRDSGPLLSLPDQKDWKRISDRYAPAGL